MLFLLWIWLATTPPKADVEIRASNFAADPSYCSNSKPQSVSNGSHSALQKDDQRKKLRPSRSTSAAIRNNCYRARCEVISLEKLDANPPESCRLFQPLMQLRPKIPLIISKLHSLQPMRPHCHFTSDDHQYNGETTFKTLSLDDNTPVRILWTSRKRFLKPEIPI